MMHKFLFLLLCCIMTLSAGEKIPLQTFLERVRSSSGKGTWGILSGNVYHRRRGKSMEKAPIRFSILFTKDSTLARITFRKNEVYNISRQLKAPYTATLETPKNAGLADFGLRPEDLTMSFLFAPLKRELDEERVRGQNCRVLDFQEKDRPEQIRVYISSEYYFPLRVEWFAVKNPEKPFRTLEVDSFGKESGLWVVKDLSVFGPGWTTSVQFKETRAGLTRNGVPKDLF